MFLAISWMAHQALVAACPVNINQLDEWCMHHGVSKKEVISRTRSP
jgi:hypothetical protein